MQSCKYWYEQLYLCRQRSKTSPRWRWQEECDLYCIYTMCHVFQPLISTLWFLKIVPHRKLDHDLCFSSYDRINIFFHGLPYFSWLLAMLSLTQTWRMGYSAQIPSSLQLIPVTYPLFGLASQLESSYTIFLQCSWFKFILGV